MAAAGAGGKKGNGATFMTGSALRGMTGSAPGGAAGRLITVGTATPVSTTFTGGRGVHTSARRARAVGTVSATVSRAAVGRVLRPTTATERQQRGEKHGPPGSLSRANQTDDRL